MRPVFLLLHAPIAFWNLFSSPPSSCASATCLVSCAASSELCSSVSIPPSILASVGDGVEESRRTIARPHYWASCTIPRKCIQRASTCMGRIGLRMRTAFTPARECCGAQGMPRVGAMDHHGSRSRHHMRMHKLPSPSTMHASRRMRQ
jgi:hypothetical protein